MSTNRAGAAVLAVLVLAAGLLAGAPGVASAAEPVAQPALAPGGSFVPVAPVRVADTRRQPVGRLAAFSVSSALPVPMAQVDAVVLNVTVVDAVGPGYFFVNTFSGSSAGNFTARTPTASIAIGDISPAGDAAITTSVDAHVVVDLQGYVTTPEAAGLSFTPVSPVRAADSRSSVGLRTFGPAATQYLDVRGRAGLPLDATAVVANLTVARASASTYVTGWSGAGARPVVSSVNALSGQIVANRVLLPLRTDGRVALYNAAGSTDLVVDVVGYVSPSVYGSYFTLSPGQRLFDSRITGATVTATLDPAQPSGRAVAPAVTDLIPTTAVWLAVAGDAPVGRGYVAVRSSDTGGPTGTSDLNLVPGRTVSNAGPVAVSLGTGTIEVSSSPTSRVVIDTFGWFRRARPSAAPGVWTTVANGVGTERSTLPGSLPTVAGLFTGPSSDGTTRDTYIGVGGSVRQRALEHPYPRYLGDWSLPHRIGTLDRIVQLAGYGVGDDSAVYARAGDGEVWAFGTNRYGELASDPSPTDDSLVPRRVELPGAASVVGSATAVGYAVVDGTLYSWGRASAQLGRAATDTPWVPAPVPGPSGVVAVGGDGNLTFAVDDGGDTWYWGDPLGEAPPVAVPTLLFGAACGQALRLQSDPSGVREVCADGTAVVLSDAGELLRQTLPVSGVRQVSSGGLYVVRVLLDDGRVATLARDFSAQRYTQARYEPVFRSVIGINGVAATQVTMVSAE